MMKNPLLSWVFGPSRFSLCLSLQKKLLPFFATLSALRPITPHEVFSAGSQGLLALSSLAFDGLHHLPTCWTFLANLPPTISLRNQRLTDYFFISKALIPLRFKNTLSW
jgi:hypothetical protein